MITISLDHDLVTVVNVFTVDAAYADRLITLASEVTEQLTRHQPGFVSASFHKSLSGQHVINYAQGDGVKTLQRGMSERETQRWRTEMGEIATAAPDLYSLVAQVEKASGVSQPIRLLGQESSSPIGLPHGREACPCHTPVDR